MHTPRASLSWHACLTVGLIGLLSSCETPQADPAPAAFTLPSTRAELAEAFQFSDPKAFRITDDKELELFQASKYRAKVRSPHCIALIDGVEFGDFTLEAELQQRSTHSSKHRDLCLFFGVEDASNFYYVHMAIAADPHAHNVFRVDDKPRVAIATKTTKGVDWGRNQGHKIKLERRLADGSIRVYFDDMNTPIMEATDKAFGRGLVGFGSFDDVGRYRNIKIHSADHRPSDKKIFR